MKAHKPSTLEQRKIEDKLRTKRAPRRRETGPIGFGQVFSQVKRPAASAAVGAHVDGAARHTPGSNPAGAGGQGAASQGTNAPGTPGATATATTQTPNALSPEAAALATLNGTAQDFAIPTFVDGGISAPTTATVAAGGQAVAAQQSSFQPHAHVTPAEAMQLIENAVASMDGESKEIHLSLNPEHLGPLVVQVRVERGKVRAELYAQNGEAVALLGRDREKLQERLTKLGFAQAEVLVEQEEESFFTR